MIGIKSVSTRTQDECILKFLQLPIEDPYFEGKERVFFLENSSFDIEKNIPIEQKSFLFCCSGRTTDFKQIDCLEFF